MINSQAPIPAVTTSEEITLGSGTKVKVQDLEAYYSKSHFFKEIAIFASVVSSKDIILRAAVLPDFDYCLSKGVSQIKDRMQWEMEKLSLGLPEEKRVRKYTLVKKEFPKTSAGTIDRLGLKKQLEELANGNEPKEAYDTDDSLLSSSLAQKALEYLSLKLKKPVKLDDHLELDLGLDSLERIGLFFEFQKLSGLELEERQFFFIATVRDVLSKLQAASGNTAVKNDAASWENILHILSEDKLKQAIVLQQSFLSKGVNLIALFLLILLSRIFFLLKVKGKQNIPKKGAFILCPNHSSYLDVPIVVASLPFSCMLNTFFLGYSAYLNHFLLAWGKKLFRLIPVDPASKLADTLLMCRYVIENGKALCLFPEGIRSFDGEIKQFKRGIGILVEELKVDAVPVYIKGAYQAWPASKALPVPFSKIEIIFGKRIPFSDLKASPRENIDIYQTIADNIRIKLLELEKSIRNKEK